jgi:hypothetical protein
MKLKLNKLNSKGFSHHMLIPLIAIVIIGGIGAYIITKPKAAVANPLKSKAICEGSTYNRTWKNGKCTKTCKAGYKKVSANPYDYCKKPVVANSQAPKSTTPGLSCFISGPSTLSKGASFYPQLTIVNNSPGDYKPKYEVSQGGSTPNGQGGGSVQTITPRVLIKQGRSATFKLGAKITNSGSTPKGYTYKISVKSVNATAYSCSKTVKFN